MSFSIEKSYSYADIGLVPRELSTIPRRSLVDTGTNFIGPTLKLPIVIAPMETVVGVDMALEAYNCGVRACMPRRKHDPDRDLKEFTQVLARADNPYDATVAFPCVPAGNMEQLKYLTDKYAALGTRKACIDVANGFHKAVEEAIEFLKNAGFDVIAGNIGSIEGFRFLCDCGADAIRVGIGNGSACTTSVATGIGVGQASLVRECAEYSVGRRGPLLIADGGIRSAGDIAKAIALGADIVMIGGLLAGCKETPGDIIHDSQGNKFKKFSGQASFDVKGNSQHVEGVSSLVPYKGPLEDVLTTLREGLQSSMAYMNAPDIGSMQFLNDHCFVSLEHGAKEERKPYQFRS